MSRRRRLFAKKVLQATQALHTDGALKGQRVQTWPKNANEVHQRMLKPAAGQKVRTLFAGRRP